jgi:hypothetical protein
MSNHRRGVAIFAVSSPVGLAALCVAVACLVMLAAPSSGAASLFRCPSSSAHRDIAVVPCPGSAAIFNWFQGEDDPRGVDADLVAELHGYLRSEHYDVTEYGGNGRPHATLADFAKLADAKVVIYDTHGYDPATGHRDCTLAKGLFRRDLRGALANYRTVCRATSGLIVETAPTLQSVDDALRGYLRSGYTTSEIQPLVGASTATRFEAPSGKGLYRANSIDQCAGGQSAGKGLYRLGGVPRGDMCGILLTAAGIRKLFSGKHVALVDGVACHSMTFAGDFDAMSYFGYRSTTCVTEALSDTVTLMQRMLGYDGVDRRPTINAFDLGGFMPDGFEMARDARPIVLSPAVESVAPQAGSSSVIPGTTVPGAVQFDAAMYTTKTKGVVTAEGCGGASVTNERWAEPDPTLLKFDLNVPSGSSSAGMITLTIHNFQAVADPGGYQNDRLDGNTAPNGKSGVAPNGDNYVWQVPCGGGGFHLSGQLATTLQLAPTSPSCGSPYTADGSLQLDLSANGSAPSPGSPAVWTLTASFPSGTTTHSYSPGEPYGATLYYSPSGSGTATNDYNWGDNSGNANPAPGGGPWVTGTVTVTGPTSADGNGTRGSVDLTIQANPQGGNGGPGTNPAKTPETIQGSWDCGAGY